MPPQPTAPGPMAQEFARAKEKVARITSVLVALGCMLAGLALTGFYGYWFSQTMSAWMLVGVFFDVMFLLVIHVLWSVLRTTYVWKQIAEELGYSYIEGPHIEKDALMLREGTSRYARYGLSGTLEDRPFRFYQYDIRFGSGKNSRYVHYSVIEITFAGTFPHLYLNNEQNRDLSGFKELFLHTITLPASFKERFKLYAPQGYEIEALEILTPDVLLHLQNQNWQHDTEFVNCKMYIFCEQVIHSKERLVEELDRVRSLVQLLAPKLNRVSLTPIGDLPSTL